MNDIDKMPVKCRDCPYWELASYPWYCGDCVDKMNPKNSEYIKRIDAKRALTALPADLDAETVQRCVEAMNNPKAADVEPKRYAEWISPDGISVCSECGKAAPYDVEGDVIMYWPNLNFCPNCGCRMNVEGKDAEVH